MQKPIMPITINNDNYVFYDESIVRGLLSSLKRLKKSNVKRQRWYYMDAVAAFDIETSVVPYVEQSAMYMWQLQIGLDAPVIIGRTWDEFKLFLTIVDQVLHRGERLLIYVHNLSYEFQFLRGVLRFTAADVTCMKSRDILRCFLLGGKIEIRCSLHLSGLSLAQWAKNLNVGHQKLSGKIFDYHATRYPWSPLSDYQLQYGCNDVRAVVECVYTLLRDNNDTLYTIPLTQTGYLRRDVKAALRGRYYYLRDISPTYDLYQLCREAFRGGNTHANRYYAGQVLTDVQCADRSSSYPDVMVNRLYPVSKFTHRGALSPREFKTILAQGKAIIFRCALSGVRLRDKYWGCPYLTYDKSRKVHDYVLDNGRILEAGYLETTLTDIDFKILCDEYYFEDMVVIDSYTSRYGKLPHELTDIIVKLYQDKTALKGLEEFEVLYRKSKERINSAYGMTAQNPVKEMILFDGAEYIEDDSQTPQELLGEYTKSGFLPYFWGVWVTAWAREALERALKIVGHRFVYCDTDGVYYIGTADFDDFNRKCIADDMATGMYARDKHGTMHYSGVFEAEEKCERFSTLGAKKYAKVIDGKIKITIAGVNKALGGEELATMGGLEAFAACRNEHNNLIFRKAGGTESEYNDKGYSDLYGPVEIDDHILYISANVTIKDSTYKLGVTGDYERLLDACKDLGKLSKIRGIDIDD